jgi:hypothetical protein
MTLEELLSYTELRPSDAIETIGKRHLVMALLVFERFLGWPWCETHLLNATTGFLHLDFSNDQKRETTTVRLFELAENIFCLQSVNGLDECLESLKTAKVDSNQVESTYAEIEFGRILGFYEVPFRFVPRGVEKSPDFEISYPDGLKIFADAKCKLEASSFSENTLKTSLKDAREQFPKDGAGIAFLKVPQAWAEDARVRMALYKVTTEYLRQTQRIASVKFYAEVLNFDPKIVRRQYAFLEISNPRSRIEPGRDWTLFENRPVSPEWGGKHPRWIDFATIAREIHEGAQNGSAQCI